MVASVECEGCGRIETEMQYTRNNAERQASVIVTDAAERDILARIVETKRAEVAALRPRAAELRARAADRPPARGLAAALRGRRARCGCWRRSSAARPSAGAIRPGADPAAIARAYAAGGAAALSVLTDREYFGGSLEALEAVRAAVELPLLRKDFVIDPLQLWEARAAGADAVLLIARILDDAQLADLRGLAAELGLDSLVEVHDAAELERALAAGAELVGVNNRDLRTFTTDLELSLRAGAARCRRG